MRPVYFPAILSPCYGLPLCNYILIPPELRAPRLFFFVPSSPLCHPRLISACGSSLFLFVIFINLRVLLFFSPPSLSLSLSVIFPLCYPRALSRTLASKRYVCLAVASDRSIRSVWRHSDLPSSSRLSLPRFSRGTLVPRIKLRFGANKKARAPPPSGGNSFCIFFIPVPAPLAATSASVLNYRIVTILR